MNVFVVELQKIWFAPGSELGPGLVVPRTLIVFIAAVAYVRLAKKRFIAQATAIDLVMSVVFGSTLSRAINGSGTLASCLAAGLAMVVIQRLSDHLAYGSERFERLIKGSSNLLVRDGIVDESKMRHHDITREDLLCEMRTIALTDNLDKVHLATLERSGRISIVKRPE